MATETTVPMDDKELFNAAMADEPVQETATEQADAGQPRDDQGRFAPKEAAPAVVAPLQQQPPTEQATATTEPKTEQAESPGLKQLREAHERAERRAEEARFQTYSLQQTLQQRERELEQLRKPKAEPIDVFADPKGFVQQELSPIESRYQSLESKLTLRASRAENLALHGKDAILAMETAINEAMQANHPDMVPLGQRMSKSDDPVGLAMQWYQNHKLVKETGGDLTAYKQRLLDEAMKDPAFQAKVIEATRTAQGQAQQAGRPNINLPPSLNRATGASGNADQSGDMSDASLFAHATR